MTGNITQYFRNAVLAASQCQIKYKENQFAKLSLSEIEIGQINTANINFLWKDLSENEDNNDIEKIKKDPKHIIIALKTISSEFLNNDKINSDLEEMTSIFFLPAVVTYEGTLYPQDNKFPWIPREFLQPMIEEELSIGTINDYDTFLEVSTDKRNQIDSWGKYLNYAKEMYEFVTKTNFSETFLPSKQIKTDGNFYIFKDPIINASYHLLELYNHLIDNPKVPLYTKITNGFVEPSRTLCDKLDHHKMINHVGQMGGEYPLSPSQREAISCFQEIETGEILAVNGPPGTGKTTLLQSIVANMYVQSALNKKQAPIIVATSTNNQAVTNIIDSFGQINPIGIKNLERRWITGVNSFSLYFPSTAKVNEAITKNYQYTDFRGNIFTENIETNENRKLSKELFEREFLNFFNKEAILPQQYIHDELKAINEQRISCIQKLQKLKDTIGNENYFTYHTKLLEEIKNNNQNINKLIEEITQLKTYGDMLKNRRIQWRQSYETLPWYIKTLQFLPYFKKKLKAWSYDNINYDELDFLQRGMTIIDKNKLDAFKNILSKKLSYIDNLLTQIKTILLQFSKYNLHISENNFIETFEIEKINNWLDNVRYLEFWLSVHYYEALWLNEDNPLTDKQKSTNFEETLNKKYHRLAMLTPCMVMTCFMLPKQFLAYDNNEKKSYHLYNFIDLLIVDEAGQISPEIGAPVFALAKKAVVVGDEQQIPPVWGSQRALDITMAITNKVIPNKENFSELEENGLNCSQSSIMKIASLSCPFEKYGKGLFLSEHRRCYNEIVEYCNNLVYSGKLEPLRGCAKDDKNNILANFLPPMGHKQITVSHSQKSGSSRVNSKEANTIVEWLGKNYSIIITKYKTFAMERGEEFNEKNIIGIITPFKKQSNLIKQLITQYLPEIKDNISVGTVHTFQGAERKVILFSTVYGNQDNCYFINNNKSLMNVAVSRAKDSFLVFGDNGCLSKNNTSASGMLKQSIIQEIC